MRFIISLLVLSLVCKDLNGFVLQHNPKAITGTNVEGRIGDVNVYKGQPCNEDQNGNGKMADNDTDTDKEDKGTDDDKDTNTNKEDKDTDEDKDTEEDKENGEDNDNEKEEKGQAGTNVSTEQNTENPINLMLNQNFDLNHPQGYQENERVEAIQQPGISPCGGGCRGMNFGFNWFGGAFGAPRGACGC